MKSLAELFNQRLYLIPQYQREYSWEIRHCQDLIEDIELLPGEIEAHYIGPIMLSRSPVTPLYDETAVKHDTFEIVDGQQRLTTLILFLLAICSRIRPYRPKIAESILDTYARKNRMINEGDVVTSPAKMYPLTLNTFCHQFFVTNLIDPHFVNPVSLTAPSRSSHKRLQDTFSFFAAYLDRQRDQKPTVEFFVNWLITTYSVITNKLKFTEEEVGGLLEAGIIFETMNNRGKPISEMDKIKNSILFLSSKTKYDNLQLPHLVEGCWEHVLNVLMLSSLNETRHEDQLLRANWLYSQNDNAKEWKGIDSFKGKFRIAADDVGRNLLYASLCEYVDQLKFSVDAYCDVVAPNRIGAFEGFLVGGASDSDVRDWAVRFSRMSVSANFIPLLMAARLKSGPDEFLRIIKICEKMAFRTYILKGGRSHSGAQRLNRLASAIYKREKIELIEKRLINIALSTCENEAMINAFKTNVVRREWYTWRGLRYFLYEYELARQADDPLGTLVPWSGIEKYSIEHILPQNRSDEYWQSRFKSHSTFARYLNNLGNLTLSSSGDNASLANAAFPVKCGNAKQASACYINSNFRISRDIALNFNTWSKDDIKSRKSIMISWAEERWHIPYDENDEGMIDGEESIEEEFDDEEEDT